MRKLNVRMAALAALLLAVATVTGPVVAAGDEPTPGLRTVNVPGSETVLRVWTEVDRDGAVSATYAISRDGERFTDPKPTTYELKLRYDEFDPLVPAARRPIAPALQADASTNVYIVQFLTQPLEGFRGAIREAGGTVLWYLPRHSHIVRMTPEVRDAVAALPFVRWVGPLHPAYRLDERDLALAEAPDANGPAVRYNVMLFDASRATKVETARRIAALGGIVNGVRAGKHLLDATLTPAQLFAVAAFDEVLFVDRWGPYETDMDKVREISGANMLETVAGYTGEGVRGEVIDVGFNLQHVDFAHHPLIAHTSVGVDSHGAATSGIIFGDGTGDPQGRGLLPDGQGIVASTSAMEGQARYDLLGELSDPAYEAVFQSSSVGSPRTFFYTTISAEIDVALFDHDVVLVQSQSNAGNQDSRPQAWAKNALSIGGVRHYDTLTKADDSWSFGASIGPAADGRVKPDLCHFYDSTFTTTTGSPTAYTPSFGGTSGATPITAGHVGLFFQMWADGIFHNPADPLGSVFDNRSHMTTAKAMLINTAEQYDWQSGGPNADIDRDKQGWGMTDIHRLYEMRDRMIVVDETDVITNLSSWLYTAFVTPGEPALKATLVYADPPGSPGASMHRINDLNLKVTSPSGDVYWGNNGLRDGQWSTPGGEPNEIDTVENVFIANPETGEWQVEVIAAELNQDAHVETFGQLDADYALVVSGVEEVLPPLTIRLPAGVPALVDPGVPTEIAVEITPGAEAIVPGSETLHYRFDPGAAFATAPLTPLGGDAYLAVMPPATCDAQPELYVSAEGDMGTVRTSPPNAPDALYSYGVGGYVTAYEDDMETDGGWSVENVDLLDGGWERGVPAGGGDRGDPATDYDGSGQCWVTDNADDNSDVDGGPTRLTSPVIDATVIPNPVISYARWFTNDDNDADSLTVELSNDDGASWTTLEVVGSGAGWTRASFLVSDYVTPTATMRLRFSATDNPNDSITEAGVDAIDITAFVCEDDTVVGDVNGDGVVDFQDLLLLLAAWGDCPPGGPCPADLDGNLEIDFNDLLLLLVSWS